MLVKKCKALSYLGYALKETGNGAKALECKELELHIRTNLLEDKESNEVAECYLEIGLNNYSQGKLDRALEMY
jgi:hypothetical protein